MPWTTPTLSSVRSMVRDMIRASLPGSDALVPNSILRVLSDAMGALAHLTLQYIDWLAKQIMVDTAETEWLDRWGQIYLVNADGTVGRKLATTASGTVAATGDLGAVIPMGQLLLGANQVTYQVSTQTFLSSGPTPVPATAIEPGASSNLDPDTTMAFNNPAPAGVDATVTVISMTGGTDQETDDELRFRVLQRIQQPPMGGDAQDYVLWALEFPGCTRAWSYPLEMGIGTVTVRFLMDDARPPWGIPTYADVYAMYQFMSTKRPVAVKDFWIEAPIPYPIDITILNLAWDPPASQQSTEGSIYDQLVEMFYQRAIPGQTLYESWVDEAISIAIGEDHHELAYQSTAMPGPGYLPVLGNVTYSTSYFYPPAPTPAPTPASMRISK